MWSEVVGYDCSGEPNAVATQTHGFVCDPTAPTEIGEVSATNECGTTGRVRATGMLNVSWENVFTDPQSPLIRYEVCVEDKNAPTDCDAAGAEWIDVGLNTSHSLPVSSSADKARHLYTVVVRDYSNIFSN